MMEKYGVMNPGQLPNHREKCIKTLQENFGVDNYFKSQEWQEKSLQNIIEFYKNLSPSNINVIEILEPEQYLIDNHKGPIRRIRFSCNKCNKEEIISVGAFEFRIDKFKDACATCMGISRGTSAGEKQVVAYIKSIYSGEVLENDRKLIYRKELDIVLPDLKLAFEYNGVFYHGNRRIDDPKYHIEKIDRCDTVGFRLVNLFEDEWLFKRNIVEKRIRYLLGLETNKLYARKCDVKEITSAEARQFVEANHIQGYVNAKVKLGLFYEGNLVSVMTFSRPNISKGKHKSFDSWEIGRFCSSTNVVGGASKLLTYFKQAYKPETIFTYSDRRWDTGKLYETLGFEFVGHTKPNYWYVKGYQRYHRFSLRKNKDDDPTLTEWQNRQLQGWNRIWDCGHAKWVWKES